MGFFSDLKADLSQAVNELMPEESRNRELTTQNSLEDDIPDMPTSLLPDDLPVRREKVIFHKIPEGMENVRMPIPPLREDPTETAESEPQRAKEAAEKLPDGVTVIAEGTVVTGDFVCENVIHVGKGAVIKGNISAPEAVIAGAVKGDIDVKGSVALKETAVVVGNIRSKSVQIDTGAVIEGMCSQCYAEKSPISIFDKLEKDVPERADK